MTWWRESPRKVLRELTIPRVLILIALVFFTTITIARSETPSSSISISEPAPNAAGEVAIVNLSGTTLSVIRGFTTPSIVEFSATGKLLVADADRHEIFSFGPSSGGYTALKTWKLPLEVSDPIGLYEEEGDSLIVFDRSRRVVAIHDDSRFEILSSSSDASAAIRASLSLSQEQFLVISAQPNSTTPHLLRFDAISKTWHPIVIEEDSKVPGFAPNEITGGGDALILWRHGNGTTRLGSVQQDVFRTSSIISAIEPNLLISDGARGIYHSTVDGTVRHTAEDESVRELFTFFPSPTSMAFSKPTQQFAFAYKIPGSVSWPEAFQQFYKQQDPFNWSKFSLTTLGATIVGLTWLIVFGVRREPFPQPESTTPSLSLLNFWVRLLAIIVVTGGLTLGYYGHHGLLNGAALTDWLPAYAIGAGLVAVATEAVRRHGTAAEEPLSFHERLSEARSLVERNTFIPLLAILMLVTFMIGLGTSDSYRGLREGIFCAALVLAGCVCVADLLQARTEIKKFLRQEWWLVSIPLIVGGCTLLYRLTDIPYFCHHDYTLNVFAAEMFLQGRVAGAWSWGEVPAPIIGTFPEMVGLLLAGPTPLGFRLGSSLFNLSAILAVYLLGRTYRNARVGFWAAILLAGSVPFMHFGRLPSNGFATTTALWALTLFALAVRYERIGLWIMLGIVSGLSFYLWPVARVGMTAVACVYLLLFIRHPLSHLTRWHLPMGAALGFALMIAPLIPIWIKAPYLFMPRANESLIAYSWEGSFLERIAQHPSLSLFATSVGWIFNQADASSQGTLWPGFNSVEAILFACGFVIALSEGLSVNVLLLALFMITTIVCGVFADGTPWYTRLLPTAPIVALLAARAIDGTHTVLSGGNKWMRGASFVTLSAALLWISPLSNFRRYESFETGMSQPYRWSPTLAIARRLHDLGPKYTHVFLARGEPHFQIAPAAAFGAMLPYIMNLTIKEVYDLDEELALSQNRPTAFVVQLKREAIDIPRIQAVYPNARIETVRDVSRRSVAKLVIVDRP